MPRAVAPLQEDEERPLTARSVLASTLLGADPPALPVAQLVHVAGLFGINENRARVALSRMVATAEAITEGNGVYRLAGHLLERQQRQATSRAGRRGPWSGEWLMVALTGTASAAEDRGRRRRALQQARLAELRQGLWLRPDNVAVAVDPDVLLGAQVFTARPQHDGAGLAAALWDLQSWSRRAERLMRSMAESPVETPAQLAPGFVLSAAVLRHLQADPLLPDELLVSGWPGDELRRRYDDWDRRYRRVLAQWSRSR